MSIRGRIGDQNLPNLNGDLPSCNFCIAKMRSVWTSYALMDSALMTFIDCHILKFQIQPSRRKTTELQMFLMHIVGLNSLRLFYLI